MHAPLACLPLCLLLVGILPTGSSAHAASPDDTLFVTREQGQLQSYRVERDGLTTHRAALPEATLGSTWKLFVFSYLVAQQQDSPDYQCRGNDPEEAYCCQPGRRIGRENALVRSCGRYFEPARLKLQATAWRSFWAAQQAPAWLQTLSNMHERKAVPVAELFDALDAVPADARQHASHTLLNVLMQSAAGNALDYTGGLLRPKTWTLPDPRHAGMRRGGAAGWLADGQPFWLSGRGAGIEVLRKTAPALANELARHALPEEAGCVRVRFFQRYPIERIVRQPGNEEARPGPLNGQFRVLFRNGNSTDISASGELLLARNTDGMTLTGRLGLGEYVARVIDREAAPEPREAARALAIVARTYLLQNARPDKDCLAIDDSTATQRVSPRPASPAARAVADWTGDLVLNRVAQYHLDKRVPGVLSWEAARSSAAAGASYTRILAEAFPASDMGSLFVSAGERCIPAPRAQQWLGQNIPRWRTSLQGEAGYSEPSQVPVVCIAMAARPYADTQKRRIYVHGWRTQQDQLAIAHEYLHLAFEGHPRALDEDLVEGLARRLILGGPQ